MQDVYRRSGDAEFILTSDFDSHEPEIDWALLEWRECDIPVAAFGLNHPSLEDWIMALSGVSMDEQVERIGSIRAWVAGQGGIGAGLKQSPLLVTIRDGRPKIEDGYHRLGVAIFDHGISHVRALCASVDEAPEQAIRNRPGQPAKVTARP